MHPIYRYRLYFASRTTSLLTCCQVIWEKGFMALQQRLKSACSSMQSDQLLCCLLLCIMQCTCTSNFQALVNFCSEAGWFQSNLVENLKTDFFMARCRHIYKGRYCSFCYNVYQPGISEYSPLSLFYPEAA